MEIPFIYFFRRPETGNMKDVCRYGQVRYLVWGCIREMMAQGVGEKACNTCGWSQINGERIV
jgi:hypothetical protein